MDIRYSDNDDLASRALPSFIEPLPPLITNPFMRPRPQKGTNLLELFEKDSDCEEQELLQVYLRLKPCRIPSDLYEVKSGRHLMTSLDSTTYGKKSQLNVSKMYTFSHIFGPECNQKEIFDNVVKENLKKLPEGHNYTLLTYGASGSGKTYTLIGTEAAPGLVPHCLEYVFKVVDAANRPLYKPGDSGADKLSYHQQEHELQWVKNQKVANVNTTKYRRMSAVLCNDLTVSNLDLSNRTRYYVWVSFVEIYNEAIYDLLTSSRGSANKLRIREDAQGNVYVQGANQAFVRSSVEAFDVMEAGKRNLQVAATGVHAQSSRSHSIFTITMLTETESGVTASYVRLCDLAGCERARRTGNVGVRMQESKAINNSLHVLERCLHVLRRRRKQRDVGLVPYRESKLTRLLGAGLSGCRNEAVSMVVTLNPAPQFAAESRHVLQLAAVAKDIQLNRTELTFELSQNSTMDSESELMRLRAENERLKFELRQALVHIEKKQRETATAMREVVAEAKDMTREYYEVQLQMLREQMEEDKEELIAERLAKARCEEEIQYLRACIAERDEEEDVVLVPDDSDDENAENLKDRSLDKHEKSIDDDDKDSDDDSSSVNKSDAFEQALGENIEISVNKSVAFEQAIGENTESLESDESEKHVANSVIDENAEKLKDHSPDNHEKSLYNDDKDSDDDSSSVIKSDAFEQAIGENIERSVNKLVAFKQAIGENIESLESDESEKHVGNSFIDDNVNLSTKDIDNFTVSENHVEHKKIIEEKPVIVNNTEADKLSDTFINKIIQSTAQGTPDSDYSLTQFEQLEMATNNCKQSKKSIARSSGWFSNLNVPKHKKNYFDDVITEQTECQEVKANAPISKYFDAEINNGSKYISPVHKSHEDELIQTDNKTSLIEDINNVMANVSIHDIEHKNDELQILKSPEQVNVKKTIVECKQIVDHVQNEADATKEKKSYFDDNIGVSLKQDILLDSSENNKSIKQKKTYFDNIDINEENKEIKPLSEMESVSKRLEGKIGPSPVKDDSLNGFEPKSVKKFLSKTCFKQPILNAEKLKMISRHGSLDLFDSPAHKIDKTTANKPLEKEEDKFPNIETNKLESPKKDVLISSSKEINDPQNLKDDTLNNFETIYNDITAPRATQFDLLVSHDASKLNEVINCESQDSIEGDEPVKYNLRRKRTENREKKIEFDDNKNVFEEIPPQCDKGTATKRSLRLRRRKNQSDDEIVEKLKDIVNLQNEFSDVTMDIPAPKKEGADIPSPQKGSDDENIPLSVAFSASKSITKSRRKLFTPRAEPLDESTQPGDSNERVYVPRPSYHRGRARRKLN